MPPDLVPCRSDDLKRDGTKGYGYRCPCLKEANLSWDWPRSVHDLLTTMDSIDDR